MNNKKSFGKFNDFVDDFKRMSNARAIARFEGVGGKDTLLSVFISNHKSIDNLPQGVIDEIVNYQPPGTPAKFCEITQWVHKANQNNAVGLRALEFIFSKGLKPSTYIPKAQVSILGLAAYIGCVSVVRLGYKYATKEECRLILGPDIIKSGPEANSTLLHRLVERSTKYRSDGELFDVVREIVKNDPEAVLQLKGDDKKYYPDQPAGPADSGLVNFCRETRAKLEKKALIVHVDGVLQTKPPKKSKKLL